MSEEKKDVEKKESVVAKLLETMPKEELEKDVSEWMEQQPGFQKLKEKFGKK